jgi:hypothetical protein
VTFDWEGVSAAVTLAHPFTYLTARIQDNCPGSGSGGGSRWGVAMTPSDTYAAAAEHRVATFFSGTALQDYMLFSLPGAGKGCNPLCNMSGTTTFTLIRLTESRLSGCTATQNLSVVSFTSDGVFVGPAATAPPHHAGKPNPELPNGGYGPLPHAVRRIEFIGDSISAGDLNDGGELPAGGLHPTTAGQPNTVCANAAFNDDITFSSGAVLCSSAYGFGAECMYTAWGGIQLGVGKSWGMSDLYPFTFSGTGPDAYTPWNFSRFPADAVVVNLGTNGGWRANKTAWCSEYVAFGRQIVQHYDNPRLPLFLTTVGPMTDAYGVLVETVVSTLVKQGVKAIALNLSLGRSMTGCYGHPSRADNLEIAAQAKPQMAKVLGWA